MRFGGVRIIADTVTALPDGGLARGGSAVIVAPPVANEVGSAGGLSLGGSAGVLVRRARRPGRLVTQGFVPRQPAGPVKQGFGR